MTERVDINQLLGNMRALKAQTTAFSKPTGLAVKDVAFPGQNSVAPSFSTLMEQAVNKVNDIQHASGKLSKAYTQGRPNVDITDVMIASQKAGVSFQAMVQVRNKLVDAYRDIMNMPL